jgi:hypothetical protein
MAESEAVRAKVVREALRAIADELRRDTHIYRASMFEAAANADDATLAKLGRMVR